MSSRVMPRTSCAIRYSLLRFVSSTSGSSSTRESGVAEKEIAVAVKDGVVTLGGFVQSYAQKRAAENAVARVAGVRAIAEDIQVKLPTSRMRSDSEIAHAAINALKWDTEVPDELLKVKVENGWITLEGAVDFFYQKNAADRAVRFLTGVKGVAEVCHAMVEGAAVGSTSGRVWIPAR